MKRVLPVAFIAVFAMVLSACLLFSYTITGEVTTPDGLGVGGVTIEVSGFGETVTGDDGKWMMTGVKGKVRVTPQKDGWSFDPDYSTASGARSDLNFIGHEGRYQVTGKVQTTSGQGIPGVLIDVHGQKVYTDAQGRFLVTGLRPGRYTLNGSGGSSAHYVIPQQVIDVVGSDLSLESITAYGVIAVTVSQSNPTGFLPMSTGRMRRFDEVLYQPRPLMASTGLQMASHSAVTIPAYVYLSWQRPTPSWTEPYQVRFLGSDPNGSGQVIWESGGPHSNDPPFDPNRPVAYLDLDDELRDLGLDSGQTYYLQVRSGEHLYPPVSVYWGKRMTGFAQSLQRIGGRLSWAPVPLCDGYQVLIFPQEGARIWESQLISGTEVDIPTTLQAGTYYQWIVDTHFLRENGWPGEVARSMSGFVY